jgi:hypothetical protein
MSPCSRTEGIVRDLNWVATAVFVALFGFITWLGFAAAHRRRGDLDLLHEWGLGEPFTDTRRARRTTSPDLRRLFGARTGRGCRRGRRARA